MKLSTGLKNNLLSLMGMRPLLNGGCIWLFSGEQPSSPNDAPTGTLLGAVTKDGLVPNLPTNGLSFGYVSEGVLGKSSTETWSLYVATAGTAGWFRFTGPKGDYNIYSKSAVRLDGAMGVDLAMTDVNLTLGMVQPIKSFLLYF